MNDTSASPAPLHVTIISDVVCPWCYIGLQRLEAALALYREQHPQEPEPLLRWEPFQLNPDFDLAGMDRGAYEQRKFGAQRDAIRARMAAAAQDAGVAIDFDRIARQPNTLGLHALIDAAHDVGAQTEMARRLFEGFFVEGVDMTDAQAVASWVQAVGLSEARVAACLTPNSPEQQQAAARDAEWRAQGVIGVPLFVFNQRWAVSGAQPPEALLQAMNTPV
jgi:predicted DsbA family dithiol-disulfide isomerase